MQPQPDGRRRRRRPRRWRRGARGSAGARPLVRRTALGAAGGGVGGWLRGNRGGSEGVTRRASWGRARDGGRGCMRADDEGGAGRRPAFPALCGFENSIRFESWAAVCGGRRRGRGVGGDFGISGPGVTAPAQIGGGVMGAGRHCCVASYRGLWLKWGTVPPHPAFFSPHSPPIASLSFSLAHVPSRCAWSRPAKFSGGRPTVGRTSDVVAGRVWRAVHRTVNISHPYQLY